MLKEQMNGEKINMTTIDDKLILPLCPCPWCKKTPEFILYFSELTWLPKICCENSKCLIQPQSKPVAIRKTCKVDLERLKKKIITLVDMWNTNNPITATHGKEIDFGKIIEEGKKDEEHRKNKRT